MSKAKKSTKTTPQPKEEREDKKALVPRKKLQSVPDLLTNGDEDVSAAESTTSKLMWMSFLILMFYLSFEAFLRLRRVAEDIDSAKKSEL